MGCLRTDSSLSFELLFLIVCALTVVNLHINKYEGITSTHQMFLN